MKYSKHPRVFTNKPLPKAKQEIVLEQTHYLKNVLRLNEGDVVRVFNGRDGEWEASIQGFLGKNTIVSTSKKLRQQEDGPDLTLIFSPLKSNRMEMILEKACELGVKSFVPALFEFSSVRKFDAVKNHLRLIESSEQCERLAVPTIAELSPIHNIMNELQTSDYPIIVCNETIKSPTLVGFLTASKQTKKAALVIGPEGGFSPSEIALFSSPQYSNIRNVSLGSNVLRSETAAIVSVSLWTSFCDLN